MEAYNTGKTSPIKTAPQKKEPILYIADRVQKIRGELIADAVDQSRTDVFCHVHNVIHFKIGFLTPRSPAA